MKDTLPILYPIVYQVSLRAYLFLWLHWFFHPKLREGITSNISQGTEYIDIMSWMARVALEDIVQGGFGHTFHSFENDSKSDVYENAIKQLLYVSSID